MTRNLKVLGLALAAVLALGALAASAASAQGKLTSDGPVTLTGTETEPTVANKNALVNAILGRVECPHSTFTGHKLTTTPHALLPSGSTIATVTPHYATKCTSQVPIIGARPATVTMNGCDFEIEVGATTAANTYKTITDLVCPPHKVIELHIYKAGSVGHPAADTICTYTFGDESPATGAAVNQNLTGAHLTNTPASDDVDLSGSITNIHDTHEGTLCGNGTSFNNTLNIDVTINGHNSAGGATGVTVTD